MYEILFHFLILFTYSSSTKIFPNGKSVSVQLATLRADAEFTSPSSGIVPCKNVAPCLNLLRLYIFLRIFFPLTIFTGILSVFSLSISSISTRLCAIVPLFLGECEVFDCFVCLTLIIIYSEYYFVPSLCDNNYVLYWSECQTEIITRDSQVGVYTIDIYYITYLQRSLLEDVF